MQATQPTKNTRTRVATALALALLVFVASTFVGWSMATPQFSKEQDATAFMIRAIKSAVTNYVIVFEELPHKLGDLRIVSPGLFERPKRDEILDGWGKPFHFEFGKDSWQVISYGRDGQPGGAGLDADLSNLTTSTREYWPTFTQFLFELNPRPILVIAFITSFVAFVVAYITLTSPRFDGPGLLRLAIGTGLLLLLSASITGFIVLIRNQSEN